MRVTLELEIASGLLPKLQKLLNKGDLVGFHEALMDEWNSSHIETPALTQFETAIRCHLWEGRSVKVNSIPPNWRMHAGIAPPRFSFLVAFPSDELDPEAVCRFLGGIAPERAPFTEFRATLLTEEQGREAMEVAAVFGMYNPATKEVDRIVK